MNVIVHGAHIQDRDGAKLVLTGCKERFPRLKLIWADGGYAGKLLAWVKEQGDWEVEIVKRCDASDAQAFSNVRLFIYALRWHLCNVSGVLSVKGECARYGF